MLSIQNQTYLGIRKILIVSEFKMQFTHVVNTNPVPALVS